MDYENDPYFNDPAHKAANDVYSLYFIGWLIGFAALIIGAIIAERHRRKKEGFITSHFVFQKTMAWQCAVLLGVWAIALFVYMHQFPEGWWVMKLGLIVSMMVLLWWWLWRNFSGYRLLTKRVAISNPKTWGKPR
ncbi:hypothetical protein L0B52_00160 [Suttonella sp. R2A3]|uniref:hypothetical protein n=1 Tax=Suttonella sp. R2A3 TaxID=2908648 RepID=UPI001F1B2B27|nr:hypothetical protein [Suttonella sp. R2A3]UJF24590.1 hypothetical protein L0B52_00160 [Suttonella sp. R2A3]